MDGLENYKGIYFASWIIGHKTLYCYLNNIFRYESSKTILLVLPEQVVVILC